MNIANIMPSDTIIVELEYTEKLLPDDGLFEFMLPTVVGPRYKPKSPEGENDFRISNIITENQVMTLILI